MRIASRQHTVSAKMWYSGSAADDDRADWDRGPCLQRRLSQASVCSTLAITLRCESVAPLETPGGAAGVLQEGDVLGPAAPGLKRHAAALGQRVA